MAAVRWNQDVNHPHEQTLQLMKIDVTVPRWRKKLDRNVIPRLPRSHLLNGTISALPTVLQNGVMLPQQELVHAHLENMFSGESFFGITITDRHFLNFNIVAAQLPAPALSFTFLDQFAMSTDQFSTSCTEVPRQQTILRHYNKRMPISVETN
jgi:hypothetical protein